MRILTNAVGINEPINLNVDVNQGDAIRLRLQVQDDAGDDVADFTGFTGAKLLIDGSASAVTGDIATAPYAVFDVPASAAVQDGARTWAAFLVDANGNHTLAYGQWQVITGPFAGSPTGGAGGPVAIGDVTGLEAALDGKSDDGHEHAIANVTGLQTALDGKSDDGHEHAIANVTGLQTALDGKSDDGHEHAIANVTGLQTALNGKQPSGSYADALHTHPLSEIQQSGATTGQVPTWNGSAYAPATPSGADASALVAGRIATGDGAKLVGSDDCTYTGSTGFKARAAPDAAQVAQFVQDQADPDADIIALIIRVVSGLAELKFPNGILRDDSSDLKILDAGGSYKTIRANRLQPSNLQGVYWSNNTLLAGRIGEYLYGLGDRRIEFAVNSGNAVSGDALTGSMFRVFSNSASPTTQSGPTLTRNGETLIEAGPEGLREIHLNTVDYTLAQGKMGISWDSTNKRFRLTFNEGGTVYEAEVQAAAV